MIPFDEGRARLLLAHACESAGLPGPGDARLIALGENAVFDLGDPAVVAKVARGPELYDRAHRELTVAHWLAGQGVPVVRPYEALAAEPQLSHGHPVTFWHRLAPAVRPARPVDLAPLLRALHRLPLPPVPLGRRDLLAPVERWLASAEGQVDPADVAFLRHRRDAFAAALEDLVPRLHPGVVHGDALPRNVHVGPDGPVLLDLEFVADDLREHDLVVLALSQDRYGVPAEEYRAFTEAYGWDVREWPGFTVLRGARETASASWVAQQAASSPAALAEFRRRVASLRDGDTGVRWYPF
ncbi:phosphotransferase enzyme family protein [Streptomyces rubellomurinus]|uniref:Aminoglycoside phosphotransferase n=2 Tax=Streptomyces TaxID=1883 RepID=A0A0F2T7Y1_STRR3|nr:aminoglycoside phosphotransferase family protein [Streptomyces rubellomurinus]KJS52738.1 aminoglycoside phosphotransferase [Streptomyces rubellomurinus subsp. indigoferus]KJS59344.1 aminoglycoside phosphotransferase [Streptomyces rubellomurinus]